MKAKLDEMDAQVDVLQAKMSNAAADARLEYDDQIQTLQQHRTEAKQKLNKLEDAGEDAWEDIRDGVESAWNNMNKAFEDAKNRFS